MKKANEVLHEAKRLRLMAATLELQHLTGTAANLVPALAPVCVDQDHGEGCDHD